MVTVTHVKKTFHRKGAAPIDVLGDVNLQVGPKDQIAILGKSGAGKSTLLHVLGTLESPTAGTIEFDGKDIFKMNESEISGFRNRQIGFVFQFHYLMIEFSALENVMMPAMIAGLARSDAKKQANQLLEMVGLAKRIEHKPNQLSGGEQQRVAIARALMMRPRLLLTDEMTGNLDPATGAQIFQLIQSFHQNSQMAVVSVTHDEGLAASYPRVYRLEQGKLVKVK